MKGEKGFALVITLIITALLVALVTGLIHDVYVDTTLRQSFREAQQASLLADSGVQGGIRVLTETLQGQNYSSLLDRWAKPINLTDETGQIYVSIVEESAKLNINSIVFPNGEFNDTFQPIALRLLDTLKLSGDLCDSVADWINEKNEHHPRGAKSSYYAGLNPPYVAKNGVLDTVEELGLVKGFTSETIGMLRPYVTVYGDNLININSAPRELLRALDEKMTDELVDRIIDYRRATPFKDATDINRIAGLGPIGFKLYGTIICVKGSIYRIRSKATVGETIRSVEAVARITGGESTILYWREI